MKILKEEQALITKNGGKITRVREGDGVTLTGNIVHFEYLGFDCQVWGTTWIVRDHTNNRRASCLSSFDDMAARIQTILTA